MATITVTAPAKIRVENIGEENNEVFIPYKENFKVAVEPGNALEFEVKTSGQVFYYLGQATKNLEVTILDDFSADGTLIVYTPAKVILTNDSENSIGFVPYRENFTTFIEPGDSVELTATNVGQALYYFSQIADGLAVDEEAIQDPNDQE